jgi:hypothetical protein
MAQMVTKGQFPGEMKFRFAIGTEDGPRSCSWKLESQGKEAYLLQRNLGSVAKISFHSSGLCRWALIRPLSSGVDRLIHKWERQPTPEPGRLRGVLLISLVFPTNLLSTALSDRPGSVVWIDPAPPGQAVQVDVFLTRETRAHVESGFSETGQRRLLAFGWLRDGIGLGVASYSVECGSVDLASPQNPTISGQVFGDLVFPEVDTKQTGRPVRILLMPHPPDHSQPPVAWELGGYDASRPDSGSGRGELDQRPSQPVFCHRNAVRRNF